MLGWIEIIPIIFVMGIYGRLWFLIRDFKALYTMVSDMHDHVFMKTGDVQVGDGDNFQVLSLDEFMDRFGFDPRDEQTPATDEKKKASSSEIEAWDNS